MISVILITGNVEENIRDCLKSIKWVDEIIVVDSESTDKTMNLKTGYKVYLYLLINALTKLMALSKIWELNNRNNIVSKQD